MQVPGTLREQRARQGAAFVSPSAAIKLMQRVRATDSAARALWPSSPHLEFYEADLRRLVEVITDKTLSELQTEFKPLRHRRRRSTTPAAGSASGIKNP
jgi:hypothetical protein